MSVLCRLFLLCLLMLPSAAFAAPQRLVALAPSAAEILVALDCAEHIVGRSGDAGPELAAVPDVGAYDCPSLERILSLRPDLCVAVEDGTPGLLIRRLRELGIAVFVLKIQKVDDLRTEVLRLGKLLGKKSRAGEVALHIAARLNKAERRLGEVTAHKKYRPSVLFLVQEKPAMVAAQGTFIGHLIERAGGRCAVAAQGKVLYPVLGREELLRLAPDVALISGMGPGMEAAPVRTELAELPELAESRTYSVDADIFTRPSIRALDAIDQLIELLHAPQP